MSEHHEIDSPNRCQGCQYFQHCDNELAIQEFVRIKREPYYPTAPGIVIAIMAALCEAYAAKEVK